MNRADRLLLALWVELSAKQQPRSHDFIDKVGAQRTGKVPEGLKASAQAAWVAEHAKVSIEVFPRLCPVGCGPAMRDLEAYLKRCGFIQDDGAVIPELT